MLVHGESRHAVVGAEDVEVVARLRDVPLLVERFLLVVPPDERVLITRGDVLADGVDLRMGQFAGVPQVVRGSVRLLGRWP